jgi:hypothetical protein
MMPKLNWPVLKKGLRLVRQHGLNLIVERFVRRNEILSSPPVPCDPASMLEVHTQVCRRDWLNSIWTLKSLRAQCGSAFSLFLYLDSNVPPEVRRIFEEHFPGIQIPERNWLEDQVRARMAPIAPAIAALWRARHSPTLCKLVNMWICAKNPRILYLDPDVLFYAPPAELLKFIGTDDGSNHLGIFNVTDIIPESLTDTGAYSLFESDVQEIYGLKLPRDFNCGLGAIQPRMLDWPFINEVLSKLRWRPDRILMVEQTCFALQGLRSGWERLDRHRYLVGGGAALDEAVITVHYTGVRRDLFYIEGVPRLRHHNLTQKLDNLPRLVNSAPIAGVAG